MGYKLVIDAVADLSPEFLEARKSIVVVIPTPIIDKQTNEMIEEIDTDEFYRLQASGKEFSTSCPSPEKVANTLRQCLLSGDDVIYLTLTSALSSTYEHGVAICDEMAEEFSENRVVCLDSKCIAGGYGMLVMCILKYCKSFDSVVEFVNGWADNVKHVFTVSEFDTLLKGGRIRSVHALVASVLRIVPYMRFDYNSENQKELLTERKIRGLQKFYSAIIDEIVANASPDDDIIICHGDCLEQAEELAMLIKKTSLKQTIFYGHDWRVGPTVGAHTGGTVLAVFYFKKHKFN